jgi:uncharacterized membrane protein
MSDDNLVLYVASYPDAETASDDWESLKDLASSGEIKTRGAVVINRSADGDIDVKEHGETATAAGAGIGAVAGLVVGLFAPPLLLTGILGAAIGGGVGALVKHHQEKKIGVDVEEYLPPGSSAIVAIVEDKYLDRVESTLAKSSKKISKAIDSDDLDKVRKAVESAGDDLADSIDS